MPVNLSFIITSKIINNRDLAFGSLKKGDFYFMHSFTEREDIELPQNEIEDELTPGE